MTPDGPPVERRWSERLAWPLVVGAVGLLAYNVAATLGWLGPGTSVPRSTLLFSAGLASFASSFPCQSRWPRLGATLIVVALALMAWATVELRRGG